MTVNPDKPEVDEGIVAKIRGTSPGALCEEWLASKQTGEDVRNILLKIINEASAVGNNVPDAQVIGVLAEFDHPLLNDLGESEKAAVLLMRASDARWRAFVALTCDPLVLEDSYRKVFLAAPSGRRYHQYVWPQILLPI